MNPPELTPQRLLEIKVLLGIAGALITLIATPFVLPPVLKWWVERRILRMARQFWCHRCQRGTDWSEDRKTCLECRTTVEDDLREHLQTTKRREAEALDVLAKAQAEYEKAREAHQNASVAYEWHMQRPRPMNGETQ